MRLSRYFLPTLKEAPSDAQIVSHQLMLRAGLIKQEAAGIYAWLPLGLRVLRKIEQIVREEQVRAGAVELLMPGDFAVLQKHGLTCAMVSNPTGTTASGAKVGGIGNAFNRGITYSSLQACPTLR